MVKLFTDVSPFQHHPYPKSLVSLGYQITICPGKNSKENKNQKHSKLRFLNSAVFQMRQKKFFFEKRNELVDQVLFFFLTT